MSAKKPAPLFSQRPRQHCPVCGETSYSAAGIHPLCAVRRLDRERMKVVRLQAMPERPKNSVLLTDIGIWERLCPSCHTALHARKNSCSCGYGFASSSAPLSLNGEES